jgi:hypothetical protein
MFYFFMFCQFIPPIFYLNYDLLLTLIFCRCVKEFNTTTTFQEKNPSGSNQIQNYDLRINFLLLQYVNTKSGDELLIRTVIIPEEVEREKGHRRKFMVGLSDEPGHYDFPNLREQSSNGKSGLKQQIEK